MTPDWRDIDEEDRGLLYDLGTLVSRRRALGILGGAGLAGVLAACGSSGGSGGGSSSAATSSAASSTSSTPSTAATSSAATTTEDVVEVPDETSRPYPGDGSNGPDVLTESGIVRRDITRSFGSSTTKAEGVPLTIALTVRTDENYLRGVQATDANGTATFTSIFPACYSGRWPHIHFEVYESVANATSNGQIVKTSQIALPKETCDVVYATSGYEQSVQNLSQTSLQSDNVFGSDGGIHQIATMTGSVSGGYTAALTIGV
jgi:protocatechuate 3,4-dioxygenase beta subunit